MMDSLRQRAGRFIDVTFPERQLYLRSDGRVQFFTFSPLTQAVMAGISLVFLGWVAFTSVNVIFKDHILAAKERHFEQMQASYESRLAELQLSYDELNGALVTAQDQFKSVADGFEAKQRLLADLLEKKRDLKASLNGERAPSRLRRLQPKRRQSHLNDSAINPPGGMGGTFEVSRPVEPRRWLPHLRQAGDKSSGRSTSAQTLPGAEKEIRN